MSQIVSPSLRKSRAMKPAVERLESRVLFHSQATSIISDNRGEVLVTVNNALDPTTVNSRSVQMHTAGVDGLFGTADDAKIYGRVRLSNANKRITFLTDQLPFNTAYSIKVSGKLVKSGDGDRFDGEFNGAGTTSGNGTPGGDLLFISKRDKGTVPVARFTTAVGSINVNLFKTQTPATVTNFLTYANAAAWDGTFIHRNAHFVDNSPFVVQGGGFEVKDDNTVGIISHGAPVVNEPGISNTRGTIAMAKLSGDPNSATNQWFFNEQNNGTNGASLDTQNGGFTAFGTIANGAGLGVMDSIGALPNKDLRTGSQATSAMDDTPVLNSSTTAGTLNPSTELVVIRRIAILNKVSPFVIG